MRSFIGERPRSQAVAEVLGIVDDQDRDDALHFDQLAHPGLELT